MLIAGNWKMHCAAPPKARELAGGVAEVASEPGVQVAVCPPFTGLSAAAEALDGSPVHLGAQNMHAESEGAFTGEVPAGALRALDCRYVILGHSERRQYYGETDEAVAEKAEKALASELVPIVCVGESLSEREAGRAQEVVGRQVETALGGLSLGDPSRLVVAYEPIWAIGTGESAAPEQAQEMHAFVRETLEGQHGEAVGGAVQLLYGGSMKPHNAEALLSQPDLDGGLIGSASLEAGSFAEIVAVAEEVAA
ncbi:MAG: triose-phosphate isomerase [Bacteroidetes bacterium QS_8_68_28]|nr:MAG: triose-phosphate isomerase [Bacteroidetes bacterium QS_8_68_28]